MIPHSTIRRSLRPAGCHLSKREALCFNYQTSVSKYPSHGFSSSENFHFPNCDYRLWAISEHMYSSQCRGCSQVCWTREERITHDCVQKCSIILSRVYKELATIKRTLCLVCQNETTVLFYDIPIHLHCQKRWKENKSYYEIFERKVGEVRLAISKEKLA